MLDWSYANGVGFTHFQVWSPGGLTAYKQCGFDQVSPSCNNTIPRHERREDRARGRVNVTKGLASPGLELE
jgi:hypothetical protein